MSVALAKGACVVRTRSRVPFESHIFLAHHRGTSLLAGYGLASLSLRSGGRNLSLFEHKTETKTTCVLQDEARSTKPVQAERYVVSVLFSFPGVERIRSLSI